MTTDDPETETPTPETETPTPETPGEGTTTCGSFGQFDLSPPSWIHGTWEAVRDEEDTADSAVVFDKVLFTFTHDKVIIGFVLTQPSPGVEPGQVQALPVGIPRTIMDETITDSGYSFVIATLLVRWRFERDSSGSVTVYVDQGTLVEDELELERSPYGIPLAVAAPFC